MKHPDELTPYELWQLEKYGNIIPEGEIDESEEEEIVFKSKTEEAA